MKLDSLTIETHALNEAINTGLDTRICIVDLSSESSYLEGHIPGAIFLPFQSLMCGIPPAPGKLPSTENLNKIFEFLGLNDDTHFIVYDDEGGGWAGRFIWTLDVIGHKHYSYLNGGLQAWKGDGLPLESKNNVREKTAVSVKIQPEPIANIPDILKGLQDKSITIWDARSPAEHSGQRVTAAKAGHIPGAINAEWTSLMDHNNGLRIREDAASYLKQLGINGDTTIITHCQSHHRSGFTYLVGKHLGFDIRGYHGSWGEWGNHPDTPVEL